MKMLRPGPTRLFAGMALTISLPGTAYAYLDPGTGSLMIQALIGAIAGVSVAIGLYWGKIKAYFGQLKREEPEPKDPHSSNE